MGPEGTTRRELKTAGGERGGVGGGAVTVAVVPATGEVAGRRGS